MAWSAFAVCFDCFGASSELACDKLCQGDADIVWYPLSFIPAVCFWAFLCGAGNLVSALVAFLLICETAVIVCKSKRDRLWLPAIALAYYLAGPMAFILVVVAFADIFAESSAKRSAKVLYTTLIILTCVLVAGVSVIIFTQYPVKSLLCGVEYSHIPWLANIPRASGQRLFPSLGIARFTLTGR